MRRLAVRSALSLKRSEEKIVLIDQLQLDKIQTKAMLDVLEHLHLGDLRTLVVLPDRDAVVQTSARNIASVKTLLAPYLNVVDLLDHDAVLLPVACLDVIGQILGQQEV
jgi:large subunit ribosomal protein L4